MSLHVLAQGVLIDDPKPRTSAKGSQYCTALLRISVDGDEAMLASLIAFNPQAVEAILRRRKGDAVAISGEGKLAAWTSRDGNEGRGLNICVQNVMSLYAARQRRNESGGSARESKPAESRADPIAALAGMPDDIPF